MVHAHDRAVARTLAWFEKNVAETRMKDPETGRMVRTGDQKTVIAGFRHDTSRNFDPALHTHAVIANMVKGADGKWRSMSNEKLYASKMVLGALYRSELAAGLSRLGYGIEKTHADGRFEIAGVSREVVEAFSTRRAEIEAAMAERNLGNPADNPRLAERAALMTRAGKRDIDRDELRDVWQKQAAGLGFDAKALVAEAEREVASKTAAPAMQGPETARGPTAAQEAIPAAGLDAAVAETSGPDKGPAADAVAWAVAHLSEREAVFARTDLLDARGAKRRHLAEGIVLADPPGAFGPGHGHRPPAPVKAARKEPARLLGELGRCRQRERVQVLGERAEEVEAVLAAAPDLGEHPQHQQAREPAVGQRCPVACRHAGPARAQHTVSAPGSEPGRSHIFVHSPHRWTQGGAPRQRGGGGGSARRDAEAVRMRGWGSARGGLALSGRAPCPAAGSRPSGASGSDGLVGLSRRIVDTARHPGRFARASTPGDAMRRCAETLSPGPGRRGVRARVAGAGPDEGRAFRHRTRAPAGGRFVPGTGTRSRP